jgi:hypothetical protein
MKFLQIIIFLYLHNFISNSKLTYHKINNPPQNNFSIIFFYSDDLPIQNKLGFLKRLYKNKFNGTDDRYPASEIITEEDKYKTFKNNENKRKLDILENEYISIYDKLELLRDSSIKPHNLAKGGLMDDYDFEL